MMVLSGGSGAALAFALAVAVAGDRGLAAGTSNGLQSVDPALCTAEPSGGPTFYSEMSDVNMRMHVAMDVPPTGDIDRDFVRMMIPHHQGAIDMARLLLKYGHDPRLKRLAQSIIVEQGQEIAYMQTLLARPAGQPIAQSNPNQ
jgi:uncharacterized protein (DUF305 family)